MSTKSKAFTAFLVAAFALAIIYPIFWFGNNASPLDKSIVVQFVYSDQTPIGEGLYVELWDGGLELLMYNYTDADGNVTFEYLPDETYTIKYSWQGVEEDTQLGRIDCSKIVWEFTEQVDYWTLSKTFTYPDETPIVGLDITLDATAGTTDASGTVCFSNVKAGDYTLEYSWQGAPYTHDISIGFDTVSPVDLGTNVLPYWTVCKTFTYADGTPVVGLDVTLDATLGTTDETGTVCFDGLKAGEYTLGWSWQGISQTHPFSITFETPSPYDLGTNVLPYWTVCKTFTYPDETPIMGLDITLDATLGTTDETGTVCFTEVKAGDYTIEWIWQGETETEPVPTIGFDTPSPVDMGTNVLPYWTVEKTFYYEIPGENIPVVGLDVTLDATLGTTDETGTVSFADVKAGNYLLEWVWGGTEYNETVPIDFSTPSPWTMTNYLPSKSGGGKIE